MFWLLPTTSALLLLATLVSFQLNRRRRRSNHDAVVAVLGRVERIWPGVPTTVPPTLVHRGPGCRPGLTLRLRSSARRTHLVLLRDPPPRSVQRGRWLHVTAVRCRAVRPSGYRQSAACAALEAIRVRRASALRPGWSTWGLLLLCTLPLYALPGLAPQAPAPAAGQTSRMTRALSRYRPSRNPGCPLISWQRFHRPDPGDVLPPPDPFLVWLSSSQIKAQPQALLGRYTDGRQQATITAHGADPLMLHYLVLHLGREPYMLDLTAAGERIAVQPWGSTFVANEAQQSFLVPYTGPHDGRVQLLEAHRFAPFNALVRQR